MKFLGATGVAALVTVLTSLAVTLPGAVAPAAASSTMLQCSGLVGEMAAVPGVGAVQSPQKFTFPRTTASGCTGVPGISSAVRVSGSISTPAWDCDEATVDSPASGSLTVKWDDGTASKMSVTFTPNVSDPDALDVNGSVTKGTLQGALVSAIIANSAVVGDCVSKPIKRFAIVNDFEHWGTASYLTLTV